MVATSELTEVSAKSAEDEVSQERSLKIWLDSLHAGWLAIPDGIAARQAKHRENHVTKLAEICRRNLRQHVEEGQDQEGEAQRVLQFIDQAVNIASDSTERLHKWKTKGKYFKRVAHVDEVPVLEIHGNSLQNLAVIKAIRDQYCNQVPGDQDEQTTWSEFAREYDEKLKKLPVSRGVQQIFLVMNRGMTLNIFIREKQINVWLGISKDKVLSNELEKEERQRLLARRIREIMV